MKRGFFCTALFVVLSVTGGCVLKVEWPKDPLPVYIVQDPNGSKQAQAVVVVNDEKQVVPVKVVNPAPGAVATPQSPCIPRSPAAGKTEAWGFVAESNVAVKSVSSQGFIYIADPPAGNAFPQNQRCFGRPPATGYALPLRSEVIAPKGKLICLSTQEAGVAWNGEILHDCK